MANPVYQIITDRIIDLMEKNEKIPWRQPWNLTTPINLVSKKHYRGINKLYLNSVATANGYGQYWLSFKQINELNGQVRKGEKGSPVVFWKIYENDIEEKIPLLRYYTVFNASQCKGIDTPKTTELNFQPIECAEKIIAEMPNPPQLEHRNQSISAHGREISAYYIPTIDKIVMPQKTSFKSVEEYYMVLFHEIIHSTGHKDRLNREADQKNHTFGSQDYSKEELIAEMGAAFLCAHTRIDNQITIDNNAAYIKSWIKTFKDKPQMLILSAAMAQKATDYILKISNE